MKSEQIMIGWASRDIVPDRPVNLCGQFHMRIASKVKDPVTLTALSISSGNDSFVWVSFDLVMIPAETISKCREELKKRLPDFPVEKLVMNVTHTHTAPDAAGFWHPPSPPGVMSNLEYREFLAGRAVEAIVESWNSRKPGSVAWGSGYAVVAHNRRSIYFDDLSKRPGASSPAGMKTEKNARMYGDTADPEFNCFEGYVDHNVNLLFTFDQDKRLTGAVYNLPCPSQETEGMEEISADFWHETRIELRKRHGEKLFLLPQCAPAGDLSPHLQYNRKAEERMLKLKNRTSREEIADRLAKAFDEVLEWAVKDMRSDAVLKHAVKKISLARRKISEDEYSREKKALGELETIPESKNPDANIRLREDSSLFAQKYRCRRIVQRYEEQKESSTIPMELHVIRLGDIVFATNTFELFLDYGIRIAVRSPAVQTFLVQLAAGAWGGYLATKKAEKGESYSACLYCNEVSSKGGQQLVDKTLKLISSLWGK